MECKRKAAMPQDGEQARDSLQPDRPEFVELSYDLHIHSCLSPCGDDDMTPGNIVGMAAIKGLDVIAVTDHNSCRNCPAVMKLAEQYKERPEICNAIGAHHEETEMTTLISPIVMVGDAISGARPGARREVIESYIKRLKGMEDLAAAYPGVTKSYAIQAGRELRVIVGAEEVSDDQAAKLSADIALKIQNEMTYPGQVKITVIRETRSVAYAK